MPSAARLSPRHSSRFKPLSGTRITTLALNLPGPAAVARLRALGAEVRKFELPSGDPVAQMSPALYRAMHRGIRVQTLDLKTAQGQATLHAQLQHSDLLFTAFRPAALRRRDLDRRRLSARHAQLIVVSVLGYPGVQSHLPGWVAGTTPRRSGATAKGLRCTTRVWPMPSSCAAPGCGSTPRSGPG